MTADPMTLLRDADPARDEPPDRGEADALLRRVLSEPPQRPRARRLAGRLAPVAVAALALGVAAVVVLPGAGGPSLERASAAVTPSEGTIVHVVTMTGFRRDDGTLTRRLRSETWMSDDQRTRQVDDYIDAGERGESVTTPREWRSYHSAGGGLLVVAPLRPSAPSPLVGTIGTVVERFRRDVRQGLVDDGGTVTEGGRSLRRYTTKSGTRIDYFIDPETDELVLERIHTDEDGTLETRVLLIERLALNDRTEKLLEMSPHPDAEVRPFPGARP